MPKVLEYNDRARASRRCARFGDWVDGEIRRRRRAGQHMSRDIVAEWLDMSAQALGKKIHGETEWKMFEVMIILKKFGADSSLMWDLMNLEDAR